MSDNIIIEVAKKSYDSGFHMYFNVAAEVTMNIAGDYNMKFMGVWITFQASMSANLEAPILFGSDLIYFGPRFESLTQFQNYSVLNVKGAGQIVQGNAVGESVARSSQAALALAKSGVQGTEQSRTTFHNKIALHARTI